MILSKLSRKNRKKNVMQKILPLLRRKVRCKQKRVELFTVSWYPKDKF